LLTRLIPATTTVLSQMFSIEERGRDMFAAAQRLDLEGITAKRKADPYAPGVSWYIAMHGSLEGCWYTKVVTSKDNGTPSGVYQERGEEVFVGSFDGGPEGTFTTTYKFSSKWKPDVTNGSEVHGRCQHPIVAGSGTGGFEGATGRLDFKDDVVTGDYLWRGHISLR
jgi:hypothetical protein